MWVAIDSLNHHALPFVTKLKYMFPDRFFFLIFLAVGGTMIIDTRRSPVSYVLFLATFAIDEIYTVVSKTRRISKYLNSASYGARKAVYIRAVFAQQ